MIEKCCLSKSSDDKHAEDHSKRCKDPPDCVLSMVHANDTCMVDDACHYDLVFHD